MYVLSRLANGYRYIYGKLVPTYQSSRDTPLLLGQISQKVDNLMARLDTIEDSLEHMGKVLPTEVKELRAEVNTTNAITNKNTGFLKLGLDIESLPKQKGILKDIQDVSLLMLQTLDDICRKHKLHYWLDFGTLLGAVRHKGFIPWDDDMDVSMLATDYELLLAIIDQELAQTDFRFVRVPSQIGKIVHKDFMPEGEKEVTEFMHWSLSNKLSFALDIFPYYYAKSNLGHDRISEVVTSAFNSGSNLFGKQKNYADFVKTEKLIHRCHQQLKTDTAADLLYLGLETQVYQPRIIHNEDLFPLSSVQFERDKFPAPHNPEDYLIDIYGDYMQFPESPHTHLDLSSVTKEELKLLKKISS